MASCSSFGWRAKLRSKFLARVQEGWLGHARKISTSGGRLRLRGASGTARDAFEEML